MKQNRFSTLRRGLAVLLCGVIVLAGLTGCKIEFPDDVAEVAASQTGNGGEAGSASSGGAEASTQSGGADARNASSADTAGPSGGSKGSNSAQTQSVSGKTSGGVTASKGSAGSKAGSASAGQASKVTSKGKYQTDPIPSGQPAPVDSGTVNQKKSYKATLSIRCDTILKNIKDLKPEKKGLVPADGVLYKEREVVFYEGETVFDVLLRETKKNRIHMAFRSTPMYNSAYIEAINNLYEFDCGELSGWMYKVNGWFPNYGCSRYQLKAGDKIEWVYTCDLGQDVGGAFVNQKD